MEDDFEDLLGDRSDGDAAQADIDIPMASNSSVSTSEHHLDVMPVPTLREARLVQRVSELERERDAMVEELRSLRLHVPDHSTAIPVPPPGESSGMPITIPNELLPVLSLLRRHIADLTRDNEALRYTFLGLPTRGSLSQAMPPPNIPVPSPIPTASSDALKLESPNINSPSITLSPPEAAVPSSAHQSEGGGVARRTDLVKVLDRVRELIRENEELGNMVLQAGRGGHEEYEKALEDSQKVITSLDADLTHHLEVIQRLTAELELSKKQQASNPSLSPSHALPAKPSHATSSSTHSRSSHRPHDQGRRNGDREKDATRDRQRDGDRGSNRLRDGERDREREQERERERERIKRHERESSSRSEMRPSAPTSNGESSRSVPGGGGLSIKGTAGGRAEVKSTNGPGKKEDDRAYKRRK
ncbi:hypothetical protein P7C73_g3509, partial [Tremellales sp. Uapishka_1]